ncbi:Striatin-4 [Folsomia candida]|uniref:Striatin-4 n=1 Tax=Folsomia candida TaxID=158441 RepID=A0A226E1B5_FOLCA|nr:Striatin-4 [Folsomia candida]
MRYPGSEGEGTSSSNNGGQTNNKDGGDSSKPKYSIPGILHFIQHEWARFETERASWELERAELSARIAFLQGERKGQENLKNDLVRRIKMLEYALKQERAKFHKLKFGSDPSTGGEATKATELEPDPPELQSAIGTDEPITSQVSWRQGRQLLRQYLQEIGYTDTIIDVRSNRVRSLLGLEGGEQGPQQENGGEGSGGFTTREKRRDHDLSGRRLSQPPQKKSLAEAMMLEAESAVMANFDFLSGGMDVDDDDDMGDDLDDVDEDSAPAKGGGKRKGRGGLGDEVDAETEEVLNEFSFLGSEEVGVGGEKSEDWSYSGGVGRGGTDDVSLGELAQLTVNNDADVSMDVTLDKEAFRKTWMAKYSLRSHFDSVRALAFHPVEPVLVTASEDHTLKMWNLQKTVSAKKNASLDVEPLYTFRQHKAAVLTLVMSPSGEHVYSGSVDGTINMWTLPSSNIDPYDNFDPTVLKRSFTDHTDSVHGLSLHSQKSQLLSGSADGSVKLWDVTAKTPLLQSYTSDSDGIPTAMDFVRDEPSHMAVAYNAQAVIYDLETKKQLIRFECEGVGGINRIICHPTLALTITAHEDRQIRFWDNSTGKMLHAMVAHLDAVTSLALDPHGLYLLSGTHRKKFDEAIHDVSFHPSKPFIASAGADGLAKVYV